MAKYKAGDRVWTYHSERRETVEACPICFGNRVVTLVLGDDTHVELPCDYCKLGYGNPTGQIKVIKLVKGAEEHTIERVETTQTQSSVTNRYIMIGNRCTDDDGVFDTKAEAEAKCEEVAETENARRNKQTAYIKKDKMRKFSWNAGYHMREAKDLRKRMERSMELAKICKERAKGES
jgi:hypothetical protein